MVEVAAKFLTVKEAKEYLELNGVTFSEIWIRTLISLGKIKSQKMFSSRVIPRLELNKIIDSRKGKK